jgi:hypothetical protein
VRALLVLLALLVCITGCGYKVTGKADLLPKEIATIAIPAFENITTRYRLTQVLPQAITREFVTRTRYRIVPKPEDADAILYGTVVNIYSYPSIFDSTTGRAAGMQVLIVLDLRLVQAGTGTMLYQATGLSVQTRYEISTDQEAYFEESDTALARVSGEVARRVVSAILENF